MSHLPFRVVAPPENAPAPPRRRRAPLALVAAAAAIGLSTLGAGGLAVPGGAVLDLAPVGSVLGGSMRAVEASWSRDFAGCVREVTNGGSFSRSSGIARVTVRGGSALDEALAEPRIVACLAAQTPGKFCDRSYRDRFVAFARPTAVRAGATATGPNSFAALARPIVRDALGRAMATGAVQPRDFRELRAAKGVPALVHAAASEGVPPRPCRSVL